MARDDREPAPERVAAFKTGLSADYVYREAKRAFDGLAGTKTKLWPGIDIDIPTAAEQAIRHRPARPFQGLSTRQKAAFSIRTIRRISLWICLQT